MIEVRQTRFFTDWLENLRDVKAKAKIAVRIERMTEGNFGDVKPVGEGVSEMRITHGPGYRVYFVQRGKEIVILLCGGNKGSQRTDIRDARQIAKEV